MKKEKEVRRSRHLSRPVSTNRQVPEMDVSSYATQNRRFWQEFSDEYERLFAPTASEKETVTWGLWNIPEEEIQLLGDVRGKDILDLGCGSARSLIALAKCGARPAGLDISARQLEHAHRLMEKAGVAFPLLEADAEHVPLSDGSFDIVFSNWGAMTTCNPERVLPEIARLLRLKGQLVFATHSPLAYLCDVWKSSGERTLVNDYFDIRKMHYWQGHTDFLLSYSEWIKLFRRTGFLVLDLIETQLPPAGTEPLLSAHQVEWARRWPMELIWKVEKEREASSHEKGTESNHDAAARL